MRSSRAVALDELTTAKAISRRLLRRFVAMATAGISRPHRHICFDISSTSQPRRCPAAMRLIDLTRRRTQMSYPNQSENKSHTQQKMEEMTKEFESGKYHPDNTGTDLSDLSGPSIREVVVDVGPSVVEDLVVNATQPTPTPPEPKEHPFNVV